MSLYRPALSPTSDYNLKMAISLDICVYLIFLFTGCSKSKSKMTPENESPKTIKVESLLRLPFLCICQPEEYLTLRLFRLNPHPYGSVIF